MVNPRLLKTIHVVFNFTSIFTSEVSERLNTLVNDVDHKTLVALLYYLTDSLMYDGVQGLVEYGSEAMTFSEIEEAFFSYLRETCPFEDDDFSHLGGDATTYTPLIELINVELLRCASQFIEDCLHRINNELVFPLTMGRLHEVADINPVGKLPYHRKFLIDVYEN